MYFTRMKGNFTWRCARLWRNCRTVTITIINTSILYFVI